VTCAPTLGTEKIIVALPEFLARYPDVEVELRLSDGYVDLIAEGVDVAIRGGVLKDSALRARRVGTSERICVASAKYLAQHGAPEQPADLLQHQCLVYTLMAGGGGWPFKDGAVHVQGRLRLNSLEGIRQAVMQGLGIAYLPSWTIAEQLRSGALRAVLTGFTAGRSPLNAVYAAEKLRRSAPRCSSILSVRCVPPRPALMDTPSSLSIKACCRNRVSQDGFRRQAAMLRDRFPAKQF
jgi:DNA-binding transcriptional LysR family regulator